MSRLHSLNYSPKCAERQPPDRYHRLPLDQAMLVSGWGIEGDSKGNRRKRQLNVMSTATLQQLAQQGMNTTPGALGEQLVLDEVAVEQLPEGTQLQIGATAVIELGELRTGCGRFQSIHARTPREVKGMLGRLARVVVSGVIEVGDPVQVVEDSRLRSR